MATDTNLIACLFPYAENAMLGHALHTVRMKENDRLRFEPLVEDRTRNSSQAPDAGGGESCDEGGDEAFDDDGADGEGAGGGGDDSYDYSPGLQLRFDDWRKNTAGFVFGTSRNCDIVLPKKESLAGLAPFHCVLTFDAHGHLVLQDLQDRQRGHKGGTAVEYDGQGGRKRRGFTWIVGGHPFTSAMRKTVIVLHERLRFLLVAVPHDIDSAEYQRNVAEFPTRVVHDADALSLGGLGFSSTGSTATSSGLQTPSADIILLKSKELGRGSQAVVRRVWDVSTGQDYASKDPLTDRAHRRLRSEVELLKNESHPHMVQCISELSRTAPVPKLVMECLPLGSLHDEHRRASISLGEVLAILQQGGSVLNYLHDRPHPIAHRDIKPGNILVSSRSPLHIKLSDFGYSKASDDYLKTYCGTRLYMAPEVFKGKSYDTAVDIWSLGMVVYEYAHRLPDYDYESFEGPRWTKTIIRALEAEADALGCPLLHFLARGMLVKDRHDRYSAHRCLREAQHLTVDDLRCGMSTPAAAPLTTIPTIPAYGKPTVLYTPADALPHVSSWTPSSPANPAPSASTALGRRDRSAAPSPESVSSPRVAARTRASQPRSSRRDTDPDDGAEEGTAYLYDQFQNPLHPYHVGSPLGHEEGPSSYDWTQGTTPAALVQYQVAATAGVGPGVGMSSSVLTEWYQEPTWGAPAEQQHGGQNSEEAYARVRYLGDYMQSWQDDGQVGEVPVDQGVETVMAPAYRYSETAWRES